MKRCTRCVLPETFPGIQFDESGICNFCGRSRSRERIDISKKKYRDRFESLLADRRGTGGYDCLMAYSGGKDSTYTLVVLKKQYDLSILALTLDNGFVSPAAIDNMRGVVEGLAIDHIIYKPRFDLMTKIFRKAVDSDMYPAKTLERASTICTSCMGIVKFVALRMAIEANIPFIMYGWSPGQAPIEASIFKNNPSMIESMQNLLLGPMRDAAGPDIERYFLSDSHFSRADSFPHNISPLAFLDYDEEEIFETISGLGWVKPDDTDPNSTNCLLNAFGNKVHRERFAYHPYAFELANLVREGYMDREEAIARLETKEDTDIIRLVRSRLDIE